MKLLVVSLYLGMVHSARRLVVEGPNVSEPELPDVPISLRGFNVMFIDEKYEMDQVLPTDRLLTDLVPGANFLRLIMNHWDDEPTGGMGAEKDCYSPDESLGYIKTQCIELMDQVLNWTTQLPGVWSTITARSSFAAGDGNQTIFNNETLRGQWSTMWSTIAARYKTWDNIAGFEVMSEPRIDPGDGFPLYATLQLGCESVWAQDQDGICFVGPGAFYNRYNLNQDVIVSGGPAIYAANFFEPKIWDMNDGSYVDGQYNSAFPCCDLLDGQPKDRKVELCGDDCSVAAPVVVDKAWLAAELRPVINFSAAFAVPVWIDQWGLNNGANGGDTVQRAYLEDLTDIFAQSQLHSTYWLWRRTHGYEVPNATSAVECEDEAGDGNYVTNELLVEVLGSYMQLSAEN